MTPDISFLTHNSVMCIALAFVPHASICLITRENKKNRTQLNHHLQNPKCMFVLELTASGQQGKPLELHEEDRRQIEEIKKELLLRNPLKVNR